MAGALRGSGLAVFAVELPGHDLAAEREPFASIGQVVAQVVAELGPQRGLTRVLLWGHSSGTALAVAAARALHERGVDGAAAVPGRPAAARRGPPARRDRRAGRAERRRDRRPARRRRRLHRLGELDAQRAEHVGAAYRHDCVSAHRYFADLLDAPAAPAAVPVTVVVAADDPSTAEFAHRHREWQLVAEHVDLRAPRRRSLLPAYPAGRRRPMWSVPRSATAAPAADTHSRRSRGIAHVPLRLRLPAARAAAPGKPPLLPVRPPVRAAAGPPPTGTRCAPPCSSTGAPGPRARAAQPRRGR